MTALGLGLGLPFGGRISNPLYSLGATFAIDAADAINGAQWILNRGTGGRLLDAQVGSVTRAEVFNGIGLKLPGTGTNSASVPDSAVFSPTDIDIRVRAALNNWGTNGANYQTLAAHSWDEPAAGTNYGWLFSHYGSRTLSLYLGDAGGGVTTAEVRSSVLAFTNGQLVDVRVTRLQSTGATTFYWKDTSTALDSNSGWTAIGSGVVRAGGALFNATGSLRIGACGASGNSLRAGGVVERCLVKDGVDGTTTFDVNFASQANLSTSFTATTGQTVTVVQASAVDTNDPTFLPKTSLSYLFCPESGGYARIPSNVSLDITSDIDVCFRVDITSTNNGRIITKAYPGVYCFGVTSTVLWTEFNNGVTFYPAGQNHGVAAGTRCWFRVTRVASSGLISYYKADDSSSVPTSWTFITSAASSAGNLATNGSVLGIGSAVGGAEALDTNLYRFQLRNGIGGTVVADVDFSTRTDADQTSFTCSTGQVVTLDRATSGKKMTLVTRPVLLFGTDDYLVSPANGLFNFAAAESFTLVVVGRSWNTAANFGTWAATKPIAGAGYYLGHNGATRQVHASISDAALSPSATTSSAAANGAKSVYSIVRNVTADTLTAYLNASAGTPATDTTTVSLASASGLVIGASPGPSIYQDGEILAVGLFRRVLTSAEIAQIVSYYGAA